MSERQSQQPRTRCRLACTVRRGRRRIRARVLDVSEGGLCIVAPMRFRHRSTLQIVIDDPRHGPVEIEGIVWHDRPFRQPSSGRKGFATGLVLAKGCPEFQALATPGGKGLEPAEEAVTGDGAGAQTVGPAGAPPRGPRSCARDVAPMGVPSTGDGPGPRPAPGGGRPAAAPDLEIDGTSVFRVRVKAVGTPRVRTLTLAAISEAAVREAVLRDLEGDWEVLAVEVDPLD